jgi:hypothetical protein
MEPAEPEFAGQAERSYRLLVQEMALRAGCNIEIRDANAFLVFDDTEERLCDISDADKQWLNIFMSAMARHPDFLRDRKYYHP